MGAHEVAAVPDVEEGGNHADEHQHAEVVVRAGLPLVERRLPADLVLLRGSQQSRRGGAGEVGAGRRAVTADRRGAPAEPPHWLRRPTQAAEQHARSGPSSPRSRGERGDWTHLDEGLLLDAHLGEVAVHGHAPARRGGASSGGGHAARAGGRAGGPGDSHGGRSGSHSSGGGSSHPSSGGGGRQRAPPSAAAPPRLGSKPAPSSAGRACVPRGFAN